MPEVRTGTAAVQGGDVARLYALVAALEARQRATEATLQRLTSLLLTSGQRRQLAALLAAVASVYGSDPWTVRDLRSSEAPGIVLTRRDLNSKRLGRLVAFAEDVPINGYVVKDAGLEHGARRWTIERLVVVG